MSTVKSLLAATDFSEHARHAIHRAAILAAELGARLEVLHVMSAASLAAVRQAFRLSAGADVSVIEDTQRVLNALASEAGTAAGIEPAARVAVGDVLGEILSALDRADMLIVGARGQSRLRDMLVGTTSARLLGRSRRPVLVVKQPPAGAYRRVLVPLDFSAHAAAALRLTGLVTPQAAVTAVHAFHVPYQDKLWLAGVSRERLETHRALVRQQAQGNLAALIRDWGGDARRFRSVVEQDDPAPLILSQEAELDADLIVMGKRDQARLEEMLLGSVARRVLSASKCDVLVVHQ